jgi:riboflavin kinase/FMN adenylyltransferase
MKILHDPRDLPASNRKVCLALGVFDGAHLGHQQVIRQTVADAGQHEALSVVVTFDRHPNAVVAPARVPPLIYSLPQKLRAISALGAEATWLIRFDETFSRQTGEEFVRRLARDFGHLHSVCVGSEFTFGHKRSGSVELLRQLGHELRLIVHGLAAVALDGRAVSSTRIREAIALGQLDAAGQMLGRGYSLAGQVMQGDQLGRKLGFATANLDTAGLALPPNGVYAAHALTQTQTLRAVVNIGVRPTVTDAAPSRRVEAHMLDWDGDLYGQELELAFVEKLREERRFESIEALRGQIARDVKAARDLFVG